ncbi:secondary thiamine-phosphate synthase enzyme YjbQ [Thermoanaerobacterium thermosaccharolyticum]|jgi:secondary thiamine-phosphate synthase enzyme|uniref:secondary thiamine-phosphate synthase enzyme YjbQ n=1 Tax=Thermoanaerobacterium thermosaccharolyticum TaxID=1517 RepID=UPI00123A8101|nr:secondary thiamine-phosphate synthase enzyme YjbQ [Thermoanaerobacterium thermosaccharolyticum]KAA5805842.1 YjbQ family protein [Thermoanaerobacterium thermosaccharolyticum]MBE0068574.1 YjbQ family protein [Thermoanaerobacterium thermosaccharolyticum]MBE0228589.1 YjbQ family protein [Thermoanaerobacterium thermosaccharolyticum]
MTILKINTHSREVMIDITEEVKSAIKSSGIKDGICTVFVPHTTAGVTINENADPDVKDDIIKGLDEIIPNIRFKHMEGNSDAHIKSALVGNSVNLIVENGEIQLGTWQGIYFCEFDGPRSRKVYIKVI